MSSWQAGHRPSQSSVSSLAFPLSPALTLRLQSSFLLAGLADASQYRKVLANVQNSPHIQASLTKCTLLQVFILVCVTVVDSLLLPAWTRGGDGSRDPERARFYFQLFWLYPLLGISFLVSGSFFTNVASRASSSDVPSYSKRSAPSSSLTRNNTPLVSRMLIILVYLLLSAVLSRTPLLGRPLSFLYLCIISSYYCFEFRLIASNHLYSLRERIAYIEERWVYFLGFGVPSTLLSGSLFSNPIINLAIWSLVFPLFLLMASTADPLPFDSTKPAKSHDLPGHEDVSSSGTKGTTSFASKYLNPEAKLPEWWPRRIYVLQGAVLLDDLVTGFLSSFFRNSSSSSGPKKSAEGNYGPNGAVPDAYAQRRDMYQRGFSNIAQAPQPSAYGGVAGGGAMGFARPAGTHWPGITSENNIYTGPRSNGVGGKYGGGQASPFSTTPPPPRSNASDQTSVSGSAGGINVRREIGGQEAGSMQSRRRAAGGDA